MKEQEWWSSAAQPSKTTTHTSRNTTKQRGCVKRNIVTEEKKNGKTGTIFVQKRQAEI